MSNEAGIAENLETADALIASDAPSLVPTGHEADSRVSPALRSYIADLEEADGFLPALNGVPNMAAIARGAGGMSKSTLTEPDHPNRKHVMDAFERMKGGTPDPKRIGALVLSELLDELDERTLRRELEPYRKSLPQLRSAVRFAIGLRDEGGEAPAVLALAAAREAGAKSDLMSRLKACITIADRIEEEDLIPPTFSAALKWLCRRANIRPHELFMTSGAGWRAHDWLSGRYSLDRFRSYGAVREMERILSVRTKCEPGTLWSRVRFRMSATGSIPKEDWPTEIPDDPAVRKEIRFLLPDHILTLPDDERISLMLLAHDLVERKRANTIDKNHAANCADPYRHKVHDWSSQLSEEWEYLLEFHSFKEDLDRGDDEDNDNYWEKGTQDRARNDIEKMMGATMRTNVGLLPTAMTLGLFAVPKLMEDMTEFARSRREAVQVRRLPKRVKPYTTEDIHMYVFAKTLVSEGGFLRQRPEIFDRLNGHVRRMLVEEFGEDGRDWENVCKAAERSYARRADVLARQIKKMGPRASRPKAKMAKILESDLIDFRDKFGAILAGRLAKCEPGYRAWAYAVLNLIYHEMVAQYPHRSRAIRETNWLDDEYSSIMFIDGVWWWRVHWTSVKNGATSGAFDDKPWHDGRLADTNGLYDALRDYTKPDGARDWLLDGRPKTNRFFVTNSKDPELDAQGLYAKVQASTLFVLSQMENEEWSEARYFGPHQERRAGFNLILEPVDSPNFERSFLTACGILLISENVANKYYRYSSPEDRAPGVAERLDRERKRRNVR